MKDIPIIMSAPMVTATIREIEHPGEGKTETRRMLYSVRKFRARGPSALIGHPPPNRRDPVTHFPLDYGPDECWDLTGWHKVQPGDRLWVRENWWIATKYSYGSTPGGDDVAAPPLARRSHDPVRYAADGDPPNVGNKTYGPDGLRNGAFAAPDPYAVWIKWPSIHMPRWASRLTLVVMAVKIERVQQITEVSAKAEGASSRPRCYGYEHQDPGWSMEWANVGEPSLGTFGEPGVGRKPLTEADIALGTARTAFGNFWVYLHGYDSWDANPEVVALTFKPHLVNIDKMQAEAA